MQNTNAMGQTYDSVRSRPGGLSGFATREAASNPPELSRPGIASFLEWTGANVGQERVTVAVNGDGTIEVFAAT